MPVVPVVVEAPELFWNVDGALLVVGVEDLVGVVGPGLVLPLDPVPEKLSPLVTKLNQLIHCTFILIDIAYKEMVVDRLFEILSV